MMLYRGLSLSRSVPLNQNAGSSKIQTTRYDQSRSIRIQSTQSYFASQTRSQHYRHYSSGTAHSTAGTCSNCTCGATNGDGIVRRNNTMRGLFIIGGAAIVGILLGELWNSVSAEEEEKKVALDPNEFKKFKLVGVKPINHNTSIFTFQLPEKDMELGLHVASCLVVRAPIGEGGKPIVRPYTPVSPETQKGTFQLMIKNYPQGNISKYIHEMKVGDQLEVKGPISKIEYKPNMKKEIGMIAGGSGITPMLQILRNALPNSSDKTKFSLIFANIAEEDILLRKEFDDLAKRYPHFKVYYMLDNPPKGWNQGSGFVNTTVIKEQMPRPSNDNLIMVCGPPGMMKHVSGEKAKDFTQGELNGLLKELGYSKDQVFKF